MYAETTVIYSDILFMINFSLDFLCLFIAGRVLNCGGRLWRLLTAGAFGGFYSFLPYILEMPVYLSLPLHLLAAALLCLIAFGKQDIKRFLLTAGTFIASSALMGGLVSGIFNLSSQYSNGIYTEMSTLSFFAVCLVSALIALSYGLICRKKIHIRSAEVRIYVNGEKFDARLLTDSGNLVTEPFSSLPVIVLSSSALPPPYDTPESETFPLPLRAIPFNTSAGRSCFFGFRPDKTEIILLGRKPKKVEAYVGIDTGNKNYSGYDGLLPASLL